MQLMMLKNYKIFALDNKYKFSKIIKRFLIFQNIKLRKGACKNFKYMKMP